MTSTAKKCFLSILVLVVSITQGLGQEIITDYDGNEYHSIAIGSQYWLQENLNCLHYADGTEIPDVVAYGNHALNAVIYGRLYTWNAAMRDSANEGAQGVCPDGWHIPSDAEWLELENFLGGASIAGGKMKQAGGRYWNSPNTGADNSSGFSALPGGEYDAHDTPNGFRLINEYAVFWTSTEISSSLARERYLAYNSAASSIYDWYKVMKYSVRAIRDSGTSDVGENEVDAPESWLLYPNSPNPFNPSTTISYQVKTPGPVAIQIYDLRGRLVSTLLNSNMATGKHEIVWQGQNDYGEAVRSGIYLLTLSHQNQVQTRKLTLIQ